MHRSMIKLAVAGLAFSQSSTAAPYKHDSDLAGLIRSSHLAQRSSQSANPYFSAATQFLAKAAQSDPSYSFPEGDCSPLTEVTGPQVEPDTAESFQVYGEWTELAKNSTEPEGYYLMFSDLHTTVASAQAPLLSSAILNTYDPEACAAYCNEDDYCHAINVAVVRGPSLNISSTDCPNPPSISTYYCLMLGGVMDEELPVDMSFYLADFHVVAAGSNVYNRIAVTGDDEPPVDDDEEDIDYKHKNLSKRECNKAPIVINADFEVDDPSTTVIPTGWNVTNVVPAVAFGFTKPGSTNNGGTYAFLANILAPDPSEELSFAGFALSQVMNTCAGTRYNTSFDYRFDDPANGQCGLGLFVDDTEGLDPRVMYYTTSGNYEDTKPHTWISVKPLIFTAKRPDEVLKFMIFCSGQVWNNYSIDNVYVESIPKNDE